MAESAQGNQGPATDADNAPVIDPTLNVKEYVSLQVIRQDDLRSAESRHVREIAGLRAEYAAELRHAESERINAIRQVDVEAVQRAAEVQATQASALAAQVQAAAEAMRTQVAAAANAATIALAAALEPVQKDISELRRAQYEGIGQKTQAIEQSDTGRGTVMAVIGAASVVVALLSIAAAVAIAITV